VGVCLVLLLMFLWENISTTHELLEGIRLNFRKVNSIWADGEVKGKAFMELHNISRSRKLFAHLVYPALDVVTYCP